MVIPFRFWFYAVKLGGYGLFPLMFVLIFAGHEGPLVIVRNVVIGMIVCLGVIGAILGILLTFGKLRMSCPFCGSAGEVGFGRGADIWMECPNCELVHGSGPLGLKLVKELLEDESDDLEEEEYEKQQAER